jgi:hypothetical protein
MEIVETLNCESSTCYIEFIYKEKAFENTFKMKFISSVAFGADESSKLIASINLQVSLNLRVLLHFAQCLKLFRMLFIAESN